jgi:hypothetical protein
VEKIQIPVPNDVKNDSSFDPDVSDNKNKQIKKAIQKQKDFLNGNIKKKRVNKRKEDS